MKLLIIMLITINFSIPIKAISVNENSILYEILAMTSLYQKDNNYVIKDNVGYYITDRLKKADLKIYPIYNTDELAGFIFEDENGNYSIGEYYADILNSIIDVNKDFELIFHDEEIFVLQDSILSDITEFRCNNFSLTTNSLSTRDYGDELSNLPYKSMNSSVDCWAACMASIIQYYGTFSSTASVVSNTGNYNMASIQNVSSYLTNIYNINSDLFSYPLGFNNTVTHIGNARPIIASCERLGGGTGHMVVIKGVYYITIGDYDAMYKLMDPYNSSTVVVVTKTSSNLSFVSFGGNTYQWASSIVIA